MIYKYDYLCEPETFAQFSLENEKLKSNVGALHEYEVNKGIPILYPNDYRLFLQQDNQKKLEMIKESSRLQYFYLSWVKQTFSQHNSSANCIDYQKYKVLAQEFLQDTCGSVLDIGCDAPSISSKFFPENLDYIGLDSIISSNNEVRLIGLAEFLPIQSESVNNVSFMTSLDHIFDYQQAIKEAFRVLKTQGKIIIATLIWNDKAELINDNVHFHHFKLEHILSALQNFTIQRIQNHPWKKNTHRSLYFLEAIKR